MSSQQLFPSLEGWGPTKQMLHAYSKVVGVVPRAHAISHPKWWHISLKVTPGGLITDTMKIPGGGIFNFKIDFHRHHVLLQSSRGDSRVFDMTGGDSVSQFAEKILGAVADLGLQADYAHQKYEGAEIADYDPEMAERFFTALVNADYVFKKHRSNLEGEMGPVQLWPHGFDLAFEWFGTRKMEYEEHGEVQTYPSQLNLGFSPGEPSHPDPYFFSNPWPFESEHLLDNPLPEGARWFTEGWQGSILPYTELVGDDKADDRLFEYAKRVYEISAPTLMAEGELQG